MFGWNRRKDCENKGCEKRRESCPHQGNGIGHGMGHGMVHGTGRGMGHALGQGNYKHHSTMNLNEGELETNYYVVCNPDRKTMEMGIYNGSVITVQKNEQTDPNIVVGVGESRYIIPRILAKTILIK